jgi:branched-chain amino acid transport system permease protein
MLITLALVSGLGLGSLYGLLALGFHVTFAVSGTVNFAQGSTVMLGAVLTWALIGPAGWPLSLAIAAALALSMLFGLAVERFAVRPFADQGSNGWLMATVAVGLVVDNLVLFTFGKEPRRLAVPGAAEVINLGPVGVYAMQLAIPVAALTLAVGLHLAMTRTRLGKAMLAVVQNRDAALLMGIDARRVIAGSYALSALFAAIAGIMIAPLYNVSSDMGTLFGIKAFAVAILGGIGSARGVMAAGVLFGTVEALITALLGSTYTQIVSFALVIIALAVLPDGLFGRAAVKKV